jgi:PAS domain S-box-containing protein
VIAVAASLLFERTRLRVVALSAERDRLQDEHRFEQAIADLAGDCAWQGHLAGDRLLVDRVTPSFAAALGTTPDEINARGGWGGLVDEEHRPAFAEQLEALDATGRAESELRYDLRGAAAWLQVDLRRPADRKGAIVASVRDVTARRELVDDLRESRDRHEAAVMAAGLVLCDLDYATRRMTFGGASDALLGHWPTELAGQLSDWVARLHPDDVARFERELDDARAQGREFRIEVRVRRADGRYTTVEHRGRQVGDAGDGAPLRLAGILRDMGEQRRAEQAVRRREEQYRFALDRARLGVWEWDYDAEEVIDGELAGTLFGLPPADTTHRNALDRIVAEDRDRVLQAFVAGAEGRAPYDVEYRVRWPDGSLHWLHSIGRRTEEAGGRPRYVGITYEATEQKAAAEQIERLNEELHDKVRELETVFDLAPIGLGFGTDVRCETIVANEALARMLNGRAHGNVTLSRPGAPPAFRAFVGQREIAPSELPMQRAAATGRPVIDEENELRFPDGRSLIVLSNAAPLFNEQGDVRGCVGAFIDITEQRRLERELQRRLEELKQSDKRKDEFLATLAHELRNPLAPIRNASMLLAVQDGSAQSIDWVRRVIDRQTDHLARLIDDLLDVSRITRDKLTLRLERVELARVIDNAVEAVRSQLDAQRHRLTIEVPEALWLQGDQVRLTQIFSNLLNNAVKYTSPGGSIAVTAVVDGAWVGVSVRDNGVGVPPDQLPYLFEMFYQVDRSIERAHAGLGIGLTLVERLVHLHGGEIVARSEGIGRGSEFTVRMPLADKPARRESPAPPASGRAVRGLRILVADDSVDSAVTLTALLSAAGHEVEAVHDGFAALQRAADFRPHVLVLDIGMPGLNGYDTCRRIRAEAWGRNAVIIAVTGWGSDEDRRRSREAGFDAHLVKPVDYTELQKYFSADNIAL